MGPPGFIGRLMLILVAALLAMIALTVGTDRLAHRNVAPSFATPFPRVVHGAGLIALMKGADAAQQRKIVRFGTNATVHVDLVDMPPDVAVDEIRAPNLEARLRAIVPPLAGLEAYTDRRMESAASQRKTEGKLTRIVAPLGDGRTLVVRWFDPPPIVYWTFLGLPPGVWAGIDGLVIAVLALLAISREMRPLRRLTEAVSRFDGAAPPAAFDKVGAPDVRRLVRAVHDMQQRVATLLGERSFLIGAISHDLRIYLTRLRLRAEALSDAVARARLVADLDGMAGLIDTSLAFARATTRVETPSRIDLGDLVAIEVEERAALGPRVRLEGRYADDAFVAGDPVALRRVVANVLDNALKFAREVVTVRVERVPLREHIVIEDDGPGIPAAQRRRVFDPFFSAEAPDASGSEQGISGLGGSGLGLAIARQIVEAHGGTIEVMEAPGTTVRIALPAWRG